MDLPPMPQPNPGARRPSGAQMQKYRSQMSRVAMGLDWRAEGRRAKKKREKMEAAQDDKKSEEVDDSALVYYPVPRAYPKSLQASADHIEHFTNFETSLREIRPLEDAYRMPSEGDRPAKVPVHVLAVEDKMKRSEEGKGFGSSLLSNPKLKTYDNSSASTSMTFGLTQAPATTNVTTCYAEDIPARGHLSGVADSNLQISGAGLTTEEWLNKEGGFFREFTKKYESFPDKVRLSSDLLARFAEWYNRTEFPAKSEEISNVTAVHPLQRPDVARLKKTDAVDERPSLNVAARVVEGKKEISNPSPVEKETTVAYPGYPGAIVIGTETGTANASNHSGAPFMNDNVMPVGVKRSKNRSGAKKRRMKELRILEALNPSLKDGSSAALERKVDDVPTTAPREEQRTRSWMDKNHLQVSEAHREGFGSPRVAFGSMLISGKQQSQAIIYARLLKQNPDLPFRRWTFLEKVFLLEKGAVYTFKIPKENLAAFENVDFMVYCGLEKVTLRFKGLNYFGGGDPRSTGVRERRGLPSGRWASSQPRSKEGAMGFGEPRRRGNRVTR